MTIDEAIKILSDEPQTLDWENEPQAIEALKLGIEALSYIRICQTNPNCFNISPLPGETKE